MLPVDTQQLEPVSFSDAELEAESGSYGLLAGFSHPKLSWRWRRAYS